MSHFVVTIDIKEVTTPEFEQREPNSGRMIKVQGQREVEEVTRIVQKADDLSDAISLAQKMLDVVQEEA